MQAERIIQAFSWLSTGTVAVVSFWLVRKYRHLFFARWSRGYLALFGALCADLFAALTRTGDHGTLAVLVVVGGILTVAAATQFVQVGYELLDRPVPRWPWYLGAAAVLPAFAILLVPRVSAAQVVWFVTPAGGFLALALMWLGSAFLRKSSRDGQLGFLWVALALLAKGGWLLGYPLAARADLSWAFYSVDGVLHLLTGIGMAIYLLERHAQELVAVQVRLRRAEKLQDFGRLAASMAHEFGNLLAVITAYSSLLAQADSEEESARSLSALQRASDRARRLIQQLLAVTRMDIARPQWLDVNELLSELSHPLRQLLGPSIDLVVRPAPAPCRLYVDPERLRQCVLNLVMNSRDALPGGGQVVVEAALRRDPSPAEGARVDGEWIELAVRDNGTGMPPEVEARLFEPFFTTKPIGHGTGIGLTMVQETVQSSGGEIKVRTVPGSGTEVRLSFPSRADPALGVAA